MKRFSLQTVIILFISLGISLSAVPNGEAGFRDTIGKARQRIHKSVDRGRERAREGASRAREAARRKTDRAREAARRQSERAREAVRHQAERAREKARLEADRARQRASQAAERARRKSREVARRSSQNVKKAVRNTSSTARNVVRKKQNQVKSGYARKVANLRRKSVDVQDRVNKAVRNYGKQSGAKIRKTYENSSSTFIANVSKTKQKFGEKGHDLIDQTIARYGSVAGNIAAKTLASTKAKSLEFVERTRPVLDRIDKTIHDPRKKEKAVHAAIVAGAAGYYMYKNKDDIQYKAISYGLNHATITVHGEKKVVSGVISDAIIARAPYLKGTRMAEDPAAVLAYGVIEVGKEDFINHVNILPDGQGNLISINDRISRVEGADDAIATLEMSRSVEGIAMHSAEQGVLGRHAEDFAVSYNNIEATVEN